MKGGICMFNDIISSISSDMTSIEIKEIINEKYKDSFNSEIAELAKRIKTGETENLIIAELRDNIDNSTFIEIIIKQLRIAIQPYLDIEFLRIIDFNEYKHLINIAFDNTVIRRESYQILEELLGLNVEKIQILIKMLNTVNDFVIIRRFTRRNFQNKMEEVFGLSIEKIEFLFDLYEGKNDVLLNITLLNNIAINKAIKSDLQMLLDIFREIFEEDSEK